MNGIKIVLLGIVALLLVVQVIDRSRQTEQLAAMDRAVEQLSTAVEQLSHEGPRSASLPSQPHNADGAVDPFRDGNVKLGVNFLLPYDRSNFHPEWLGGTEYSFGDTSKSLNPLLDNSATTQDVHGTINDTLCFHHPRCPEQWMSSLAESVIISDDYKVYTFVLRPGVIWQNPPICDKPEFAWVPRDVPLTARDFTFLVEMIKNPDVICPQLRVYYDDLDKAEALDDRTLRLTWKRKVYTSLAASMEIMPLPRFIYSHNRDGSLIPDKVLGVQFNSHWFDQERQAIGVGAYMLDAYEPGKRIHYHRNPNYWGAGENFSFKEDRCDIKNPEAQLVAFKNGDVCAYALHPNKYKSEILDHNEPRFAAYDPANPKAGRTGSLGWETCQTLSFNYIGWNMQSDLFKDKRVRQAMSYAFPKKRLIKDVFYGLGQSVLSDVHPASQYYNHDLNPYDFDLGKARALLEKAGWSDTDGDGILDHEGPNGRRPFRFKVKYVKDRPEWDASLLIYREQLKSIGIDMELVSLEWPEMMRVYEDKDFDAVVGGWRMDLDIDFYQLWNSSQAKLPGSSNHCGFANKHFDELADKLRVTFAVSERIPIAKECQAILNEEQPYTFFMNPYSVFCWQNHGPPPAKDRYLDGVIYGLDHFNPLFSRSDLYWHFRND